MTSSDVAYWLRPVAFPSLINKTSFSTKATMLLSPTHCLKTSLTVTQMVTFWGDATFKHMYSGSKQDTWQKGITFYRNCGAASVEEYNRVN